MAAWSVFIVCSLTVTMLLCIYKIHLINYIPPNLGRSSAPAAFVLSSQSRSAIPSRSSATLVAPASHMWPLKFLLCFLFWEASCQCAEDCDSPALLSVAKHGGSFHNARLLRCAWAPPGDAACFDTEPPPTFTVKFVLRDGRSFKVRTSSLKPYTLNPKP